jgi:hypothetical protein
VSYFDDMTILRGKGIIEGATTLSEAAKLSRKFADYLESLEKSGWQLCAPVHDGYGVATETTVEYEDFEF